MQTNNIAKDFNFSLDHSPAFILEIFKNEQMKVVKTQSTIDKSISKLERRRDSLLNLYPDWVTIPSEASGEISQIGKQISFLNNVSGQFNCLVTIFDMLYKAYSHSLDRAAEGYENELAELKKWRSTREHELKAQLLCAQADNLYFLGRLKGWVPEKLEVNKEGGTNE